MLSESGLQETVYNDFYIGDNCDVLIVAGCGIDNCGTQDSEHDGIHRFYIGKNSRIRYVEKHYGSGDGSGKRILNPGTDFPLQENLFHCGSSFLYVSMLAICSWKNTSVLRLQQIPFIAQADSSRLSLHLRIQYPSHMKTAFDTSPTFLEDPHSLQSGTGFLLDRLSSLCFLGALT